MNIEKPKDCKFDVSIKADSAKGLRNSLMLLLNTIDKEDFFEDGKFYKIKMDHQDLRSCK